MQSQACMLYFPASSAARPASMQCVAQWLHANFRVDSLVRLMDYLETEYHKRAIQR